MIEALIIVTVVLLCISVGGQAILAAMAWPLIGDVVAWYVGLVGPLSDGLSANLIYGAMAAQMIVIPLAVVIHGPGIVKRALTGPSDMEVVRKVGNWD